MKHNILQQTASHTVGPFFAYGLTAEQYKYKFPSVVKHKMRKEGIKGTPITLSGQVFDGEKKPLNDAMIEIWHSDPNGNYATHTEDGVFGFGRSGTGSNEDLTYLFETFKPGSISEKNSPHINVIVFARGMQNHLFTRIYFPEDENLFCNDSLLQQINPSLYNKLTAKLIKENSYSFDIILQGENESIFFDI
jgi:protocatechuate 3,4-dioxygenase alpha subunit